MAIAQAQVARGRVKEAESGVSCPQNMSPSTTIASFHPEIAEGVFVVVVDLLS